MSKRTSGALSYLPGSSLSPVWANLLTAEVIIGAHYDRMGGILSHIFLILNFIAFYKFPAGDKSQHDCWLSRRIGFSLRK
jgi:hypothetical protein